MDTAGCLPQPGPRHKPQRRRHRMAYGPPTRRPPRPNPAPAEPDPTRSKRGYPGAIPQGPGGRERGDGGERPRRATHRLSPPRTERLPRHQPVSYRHAGLREELHHPRCGAGRQIVEGRTETVDGLSREASTFYEYVVQLAFDGAEVPAEHRESLKKLVCGLMENLQETIGIIDSWRKPIEVKRLRGNIDTEILLAEGWTCKVKHGNNQSWAFDLFLDHH